MSMQPKSDVNVVLPVAVPEINSEKVCSLVAELYGITAEKVETLPGYVDKNYRITTKCTHKLMQSEEEDSKQQYVLKILNDKESLETDYIDAQNDVMLHLSAVGIACCTPVPNRCSKYNALMALGSENSNVKESMYSIRLLNYVDGRSLASLGPHLTYDHLYEVGSFIASMDLVLQDCRGHKGFFVREYSIWNMENIPKLRGFLGPLEAGTDTELCHHVQEVIGAFETDVIPEYSHLQKALIHADCNPHNILMLQGTRRNTGKLGVIDFGESINSFLIFELAIAMCHILPCVTHLGIMEAWRRVYEGFNCIIPLNKEEISVLPVCIAARMVQLIVLGKWYSQCDTVEGSAADDIEEFWKLLKYFWDSAEKNKMGQWV